MLLFTNPDLPRPPYKIMNDRVPAVLLSRNPRPYDWVVDPRRFSKPAMGPGPWVLPLMRSPHPNKVLLVVKETTAAKSERRRK